MHFHPVCHAFLRLYVCRRPIAAPCAVRCVHTTHSLCLPWRFRCIRVSSHPPATLSMLLSFYPHLPLYSQFGMFSLFIREKVRDPRRDGTLTCGFKHTLFAALHWGSLLGLFLRRHNWQVYLFWAFLSLPESCLYGLGVDGLGVVPWVGQPSSLGARVIRAFRDESLT
jgi:hypothetical protein